MLALLVSDTPKTISAEKEKSFFTPYVAPFQKDLIANI